jgi:hypothetical protein
MTPAPTVTITDTILAESLRRRSAPPPTWQQQRGSRSTRTRGQRPRRGGNDLRHQSKLGEGGGNRRHLGDQRGCVALPANKWRTVCYHFATQLPNMSRDWPGSHDLNGAEKSNKQVLTRTVRYKNGLLFPNFKTGALNHSATLPSLEFSDLAGAWVRGKYQLPTECRGLAAGHVARANARRPRYAGAAIVGNLPRWPSRTRKPASSSTAAQGRLRSARGSHRKQGRDYA